MQNDENVKKLNFIQIIFLVGFCCLLFASLYAPGFAAYMDATPALKWSSILLTLFIAVKVFPGIEHVSMDNWVMTSRREGNPDHHTDYAMANTLIDTFVDMKPQMQRDCPTCHSKVVEGQVPEKCTLAKGCARSLFNRA